jgi:hypothetical protein
MINLTHSDIYAFVHALTKSEKRFFKLQIGNHPSQEVLSLLFDYFDKRATKNAHSHTDILVYGDKKNSAEHLHELYEQILRSQRLFYADSIVNFRIKDDIDNLYVLYNKGQYKQCLKMLKALKQMAIDNEKFHFALEIIDLEKELHSKSNVGLKSGGAIEEEERVTIELEKNLSNYIKLYAQIKQVIKSQAINANETNPLVEYTDFLKEPILQKMETAKSIKARLFFYKCLGLCYTKLGKEVEREQSFSKCYQLFKAHAFLKAEMPRIHLEVYYQLINHSLETNQHGVCRQYLHEFEDIDKKPLQISVDIKSKYESYMLNSKLVLALDVDRLSEANRAAEQIEKHIAENQEIISKEDHLVLLFNITNYYILFGSPNKAKVSNTFMLSLSDKNSRWDIQHYGQLQQLILFYELEQMPQFLYALNALKKQKLPTHLISKTEQLVLDYFTKLSGRVEEDKYIFEKLQKELLNLKDSKEIRVNKFYFDFIKYTKQKINK